MADPAIFIFQPSPTPARHRSATLLGRAEKETTPGEENNAVALVCQAREHVTKHLDEMVTSLSRHLAEILGRPPFFAATAQEAADRVKELAEKGSVLAINKSAVLKEILPSLGSDGRQIVESYYQEFGDFSPRLLHPWQLPADLSLASNWELTDFRDRAGQRYDFIGLLGVNAVSAATGAIFFLQHFCNISKILRGAKKLILVIALDKIAGNDTEATRQTALMARFGYESVVLGLKPKKTTPYTLEDLKPVDSGGGREVHVILLDNGRRTLLGGDYEDLFGCIGCRACIRHCPTYPYFRGENEWNPKEYLMSHRRGENGSLGLCSYCGNCEADCPIQIPIPGLIARRRQEMLRRGRDVTGWRNRVIGDVELISGAFSLSAPLSNRLAHVSVLKSLTHRIFGLEKRRSLPTFHRATFENWFRKRGVSTDRGKKVVYYFGCFANYNDPGVGQATVEVLERNGYQVLLPEWRCCGMPLLAKGEVRKAAEMAEANLDVLSRLVAEGYEIITSCPSCQLALRRDYPFFFASEKASAVSAHTHFVSRFLVNQHERGELDTGFQKIPVRAAYHLPCHLRVQEITDDSLLLLRLIPGLQMENINRGCCGLSGTFGFSGDHYPVSMEIGSELFQTLARAQTDVGLTDCGACKLQMEHGTNRRVYHPLEFLQMAYQGRHPPTGK